MILKKAKWAWKYPKEAESDQTRLNQNEMKLYKVTLLIKRERGLCIVQWDCVSSRCMGENKTTSGNWWVGAISIYQSLLQFTNHHSPNSSRTRWLFMESDGRGKWNWAPLKMTSSTSSSSPSCSSSSSSSSSSSLKMTPFYIYCIIF